MVKTLRLEGFSITVLLPRTNGKKIYYCYFSDRFYTYNRFF